MRRGGGVGHRSGAASGRGRKAILSVRPSVLLPRDGLEAISPPPSPSSLPAAFLATQRPLHPLLHLSSLQQRLPSKKTGQGTWRENASKKSVVRAIGGGVPFFHFLPPSRESRQGREKESIVWRAGHAHRDLATPSLAAPFRERQRTRRRRKRRRRGFGERGREGEGRVWRRWTEGRTDGRTDGRTTEQMATQAALARSADESSRARRQATALGSDSPIVIGWRRWLETTLKLFDLSLDMPILVAFPVCSSKQNFFLVHRAQALTSGRIMRKAVARREGGKPPRTNWIARCTSPLFECLTRLRASEAALERKG